MKYFLISEKRRLAKPSFCVEFGGGGKRKNLGTNVFFVQKLKKYKKLLLILTKKEKCYKLVMKREEKSFIEKDSLRKNTERIRWKRIMSGL